MRARRAGIRVGGGAIRKAEAAYVVLGGEGAVARAILSDTAECPAIIIGTASSPMRVRAKPDSGDKAAFPVLVCEASIPSGTTSAAIEGRAMPLPKPSLSAIAALGDTGCLILQRPPGRRTIATMTIIRPAGSRIATSNRSGRSPG